MAQTQISGEAILLSHLQHGYQLETDSLGGDPLLRRLKDSEVIRPLSATPNTVKALELRGLVVPAKSDDPMRVVWQLQKTKVAKSRGGSGLSRSTANPDTQGR